LRKEIEKEKQSEYDKGLFEENTDQNYGTICQSVFHDTIGF